MSGNNHALFLHRVFQYIGIIAVFAVMGGGYWYWKNAQAGATLKTADNLGLVGYWSFNEGTGTQAGDASGQENTGTLTNGPTWVDGARGKAVSFDGLDDVITAGSASSLDDMGARTLSAWIYPESMGESSKGRIFDKAATTTPTLGWIFNIANNEGDYQIGFTHSGSTVLSRRSVANTIVPNVWQHVLVTWDGSTTATNIRIYVNGTEVSYQTTSNGASLTSDAAQTLRIGNSADGARTFDGYIDEPRIYDRVLGATEIADLYALGATKFQDTQSNQLTNGLVGYWPMNGPDVSSTTAYDRSGQGNNGTLTNSPTPTIGRSGQGVSFDGTDDYVNAGNRSIIDGASAASVCTWMKYDPTSVTADASIVSKWTSSGGGWLFWVDDVGAVSGRTDTISFSVSTTAAGGTGRVEGPTGLVTPGSWDFYCGTFQGGSHIRLYKNGSLVQENTTSIVSSVASNTSNMYLANSADPSSIKYLDGVLDEPRIYNRALSASEISDLYQLGNPDKVNSEDSQENQSTSGLVGYWPMNGPDVSSTTAYDRSGQGNNGTLTNGPTPTIGKVGQALDFNGSTNYVDLGIPSSLNLASANKFTLSAWVYPTSAPNGVGVISEMYTPTSTTVQYEIGFDQNLGAVTGSKLAVGFYDGSWRIVKDSGNIELNQWAFISGTWDGTTLRLYKNGVEINSSTPGGSLPSSNFDKVVIGKRHDVGGLTNFFPGKIDEVRIYNRALTAAEISALYYAGR